MQLKIDRDDTCSPDVQVMLYEKRDAINCLMVVRGCTEDLIKLEIATKAILHYAKKATANLSNFAADLCFFYSPLAWKVGSCTNLDKLFLEEFWTRDILDATIDLERIETTPTLNELLRDSTSKSIATLTQSILVTKEKLHDLGYETVKGEEAQALLNRGIILKDENSWKFLKALEFGLDYIDETISPDD